MQYHVAVIGHDEGVAVHAELIWQREFADVVDRHIRAGHAEQLVLSHACLVFAAAPMIEHGRTDGSQQSVFLPGGRVQGGRIRLNVLVLAQLCRAITEDGEPTTIYYSYCFYNFH